VPDVRLASRAAAMTDHARLRPLSEVADWIFDLDNTLYPARCNLFAQVDRRIGQFIEGRLGLDPVTALNEVLARLPGRKFIFTNGSTAHADRVMARLGVAHHFEGVFDIIAADYRPKPDPATYDSLIRRHGIDANRAAMIEDLPRNLRPAANLGMTTVLVLTGEEWAETDAAGDHIHHVTDDLVGWLTAHAPKPSR
jgi:putative hydrolase of the HAD superfamily